MKTLILNFIFCLLLSSQLNAQIIRDYKLANFEKVNIGSAIVIKINHSDNFKVVSKGKKDDLDELSVYVSNKTLIIESKEKWSLWNRRRHERIEFMIEMPQITSANFSGATQSLITGFDELNQLDIELSGASKSKVDVFVNKLNAELSGASQLKLIGRADKIDLALSGASSINAENFPTKTARIDASGASNVKLAVSDNLQVDASGAANIKYIGNPKIHKSTSGGANISKISK